MISLLTVAWSSVRKREAFSQSFLGLTVFKFPINLLSSFNSVAMKLIAIASLLATAYGQTSYGNNNSSAGSGPGKDGKYTIEAEGIRAKFIPYGASISNLFIKDKHGVERDIVLGFDNATYYSIDKQHPHLGGVPGMFCEFSCSKYPLTSCRPLCKSHKEQHI